jgi:hypothetical protein
MLSIAAHFKAIANVKNAYHLLLVLTFAGVIPFLILVLMLQATWFSQSNILDCLCAYAAVILTFLGGIQWGLGVSKLEDSTLRFPHVFTLSILPSLVAWLCLMLHSPRVKLITFIISFLFVLGVDGLLTLQKILPSWFLKVRLAITLIVITLLVVVYSGL